MKEYRKKEYSDRPIKAIEARRLELGLSRKQMCILLETNQSRYSDMMHGRRNVSMRMASLAYRLGVPAEELVQ